MSLGFKCPNCGHKFVSQFAVTLTCQCGNLVAIPGESIQVQKVTAQSYHDIQGVQGKQAAKPCNCEKTKFIRDQLKKGWQ